MAVSGSSEHPIRQATPMEEPLAAARRDAYIARNPIPESENAMHRDEGAAEYGFNGGLVPGITLLAYACESLRGALGEPWLQNGYARLVYRRPIYDRDAISVEVVRRPSGADADVVVRSEEGLPCAVGEAAVHGHRYTGSRPSLVSRPLPTRPAEFAGHALVAMEELGSIVVVPEVDQVCRELATFGLDPSWYANADVVPLAYLAEMWFALADANFVRSGPSILAGNELSIVRPVAFGERLSLRARIDRLFMRRGNRYATFEIGWFGEDDAPCLWALHTSIYEPRRTGH